MQKDIVILRTSQRHVLRYWSSNDINSFCDKEISLGVTVIVLENLLEPRRLRRMKYTLPILQVYFIEYMLLFQSFKWIFVVDTS